MHPHAAIIINMTLSVVCVVSVVRDPVKAPIHSFNITLNNTRDRSDFYSCLFVHFYLLQGTSSQVAFLCVELLLLKTYNMMTCHAYAQSDMHKCRTHKCHKLVKQNEAII